MKNYVQELCQILYEQLNTVYNSELIENYITYILKSDYFKNIILESSDIFEASINRISKDLARGRPIQFCLEEGYFMDLVLFVDERVLVPRPETEELVEWCLQQEKLRSDVKVLDVGTGSGCIAIQLARKCPGWKISGIDISVGALEVARKNIEKYKVNVVLLQQDFLEDNSCILEKWDILISNPPYISVLEKNIMSPSVTEFEPAEALFPKGIDELVFYKRIAEFGKQNLNPGGVVYCEMNEFNYQDIEKCFADNSYSSVEIKKDLQGKYRMLRAAL